MHCLLIFTVVPLLVMCDQSSITITTDQIINTLTRALNFFSLNINQVNLDAGIGTRMAADQLRVYTMCKQGKSVKKLVDLSEYVTWQIARSVRRRQPNYYAQLSFLLTPGIFSKIESFQFHRNKYQIHTEKQCSSSKFIEENSDRCLHALGFSKCNETEPCIKLRSDRYACRYSLTHQILYSIVAKQSLCHQQHRLSPLKEYQMISRMLNESQTIANKNFPESDRDLFMEQIAFGGLLGWSEFFQENNWFNEIMSWQHPNKGCYGNDTNHVNNKREEMLMFHQCLSHRTSVAIAALSQILRYLLSRDI
ncbi:unnamed protein product [Rotaria magnacalcarata]|uniref:Uncharacterized protein n=4 Tax=Rotaria magnacalcarata TaxID=392030 RepID=A0A816T2T7_9BILA|nr:unnamed protein product [Rotaria magnacalcarata]CAF2092903.1 unnamed protein product [Rotaria magnacalcarata]